MMVLISGLVFGLVLIGVGLAIGWWRRRQKPVIPERIFLPSSYYVGQAPAVKTQPQRRPVKEKPERSRDDDDDDVLPLAGIVFGSSHSAPAPPEDAFKASAFTGGESGGGGGGASWEPSVPSSDSSASCDSSSSVDTSSSDSSSSCDSGSSGSGSTE